MLAVPDEAHSAAYERARLLQCNARRDRRRLHSMVNDMTEPSNSISKRVVIVGGGVAGLEALLALRALLSNEVAVTLVEQHEWFTDRPMTVAEPFHLASAARHSMREIATELATEFVPATVTALDAAKHRITCSGGTEIAFDTLILAPGAHARPPFAGAITFGLEGSGQAVRGMLDQVRSGQASRVTFVASSMTGWLLPLYELALMTARELARNNVHGVQLHLLTPEKRPLELFGDRGSQSVSRLLAAAGIEFVHASFAEADDGGLTYGALGEPSADYVVTLPLLSGPALTGVPTTPPRGFIPVDEHGRVLGLADVYAAGDAVDFAVKQGGLAAQQADAVAEHVAATYGASVEPAPFRPVLRGMVFTGDEPRFMRSGDPSAWYPLWWPPSKVAGRYLAPYLWGRSDEEGFAGRPEEFVEVDIPLTAASLPG
jgi:sulfide:quinone oxidoreductase